MRKFLQWLSTEEGLALAGITGAAAWGFIKSLPWVVRWRARKYGRALGFVEEAVDSVYQSYVRDLKIGREDGRLTPEEVHEARRRARLLATKLAYEQGMKLLKVLSGATLDLEVTKAVNRLKNQEV